MQHGGSGLGMTWAESGELYVDELDQILELIRGRRESEARAIKAKSR